MIVLVGLPKQLRPRLEQEFRDRAKLRTVPMKQDGGYLLEAPPAVAKQMIEQFADAAPAYDRVTLIVLPYATVPTEVQAVVDALEQLGAKVSRPAPSKGQWPARPPRLDQTFLEALRTAVAGEIARHIPAEEPLDDEEREVVADILRGLASHTKMGPNNHSHEDDLWKSRGKDLGPGGRTRVTQHMLREGLIDRKKNASMGGTGWVYWIADVAIVRAQYPALEPYLA